jgi:hypothetical protein
VKHICGHLLAIVTVILAYWGSFGVATAVDVLGIEPHCRAYAAQHGYRYVRYLPDSSPFAARCAYETAGREGEDVTPRLVTLIDVCGCQCALLPGLRVVLASLALILGLGLAGVILLLFANDPTSQ